MDIYIPSIINTQMNEFSTSAVCGSNVARFFIITYAHGKLKIGGFEKLSFFESTNLKS